MIRRLETSLEALGGIMGLGVIVTLVVITLLVAIFLDFKSTVELLVQIETINTAYVWSLIIGIVGSILYMILSTDAKQDTIDLVLLFLAISIETYHRMKSVSFIERQLERYQFNIILVDLEQENIVQWIH